jgi:hypothetical protein
MWYAAYMVTGVLSTLFGVLSFLTMFQNLWVVSFALLFFVAWLLIIRDHRIL